VMHLDAPPRQVGGSVARATTRGLGWTTVLLIMLCLPTCSYGQTLIDAGRRVDWSQAGVTGGIPNRNTICATLNAGATAAQINSAIAACPVGQVVFLNAGTYSLSSGIDFNGRSNVTLRGAGPDQTILKFTGSTACRGMGADICVAATDTRFYFGNPTFIANWTAGYVKGTTQITLSNTLGLAVGAIIVLDQLDDATDSGTTFVCQTGVCATDGLAGAGRSGRAQAQMVKVTAISGNTVTISPALYMPNWRPSQSPQAFWGNSNSTVRNDGVEGLTVDNTSNTSGNRSNIYLIWCYDCWIKNVKSLNSDRNHVWLYQSAHVTVRDSYFYGTLHAASQSYGVESFLSADNLVENNIFQHITAPTVTDNTEGTVIAYNYSIDDYYTLVPTWMMPSQSLHAAGTDMLLNEGNVGAGSQADIVHGTHHFVTIFRNYYTGFEPGKTAQTVPINLYSFSRYFNVIGNVLGTPGYHNTYESVAPTLASKDTSIYRLGDGGDVLVKTTLMRWGNYDSVTGISRFVATEVPASLSLYANPVPVDQILPASLYRSSKPSWWGTMPWPAIGPDVTGGQDPSGHAYKIPAQVCYGSSPKNPDGTLIFNADKCYGNTPSSPPNPPASFRMQ